MTFNWVIEREREKNGWLDIGRAETAGIAEVVEPSSQMEKDRIGSEVKRRWPSLA